MFIVFCRFMAMARRQDISRRAHQIIGPLMGAAMMAYFGYHAVQGDRGLLAWWNLRYEIVKTDFELAQVTEEKQALEHRVALLSPASLDRDMLEERARVMVGSVAPDDTVVPMPALDIPKPTPAE